MAYGNLGVGKDGNRGIATDSPGPEQAHLPDAFAYSVQFSAPKGQRLGEQTQGRSWQSNSDSRDSLSSAEITPREQYNFASGGEPGLLGQDRDDYNQGFVAVDPSRPNLPNPEFPGESGTTNMGQQGNPVDWNAVAPYEYNEFPMQSNAADVHASSNPVPLT